ncbi:flagellinolysin [Clostridium botulinum]|uniref:Flagellin n=1 Tax=Clostridium botulinum C/D str. DC5 TaxID=1443128 RepID=A0A0A0INU7_CLOBO|nr:flagellinolysin [Clostridium botulinum]KGN01847.1 hypothetical protein Z955_00165 [Clostridium botulinum C/D str. DC5]KOC55705.1 hypothetical protein ADU89_05125 [Clostridium botulinum]KOC57612.1 hypothetical protein ADU90_05250 [Clostridium botulinum]MCD3232822.1 flagellinolysin [Clostridium botulinum D/C]MCD3238684.1 flagellinolysin [Clostridium botulinum D/C]
MIINHNMNAMNAHRQMGMNTIQSGKAMEKLSSGLRINRAGDDAAGLAISEKMRGQIRGLDQASRNAQDGISLIQTAEGALNETHSIVQRMRELSVQAVNDTNTKDDRNQLQKEINQLIEEVDRIGNTTEFNTIKLLTSGVKPEVKENIIKGLKTGWLEGAVNNIKTAYGIEPGGTNKLKVTISDDGAYGTLAYVGGKTGELELHIDSSDFEKGDGESGNNIHGKLYDDRIIQHEMTHAVMNDALGLDKMNDLHKNNKVWFVEGTAEAMAGADERVKGVIGNNTQTAIDNTKVSNLATRADALLNGASWSGSDEDYAAGYLMVKYISKESGKNLKNVMTAIKNNGANGLDTAIDLATLKTNFKTNLESYIKDTTKVKLDWGTDEADVGSIRGSDHGGGSIKAEDVVSGTTAVKEQPLAGKFEIIWPDDNADGATGKIQLQVGANEGQSITINLKDMRSSALGIEKLEVTSFENASKSIKSCDTAIERISNFRSELGAYQNRLEHTINNLNTSSENLQASESRIRDVDMAKEMMNFSKNNILAQAAQAMLAQANQQPQGILQLLR